METTHLFAGLAVSDFAAAHDWYQRLFGSPPNVVPKDDEALWHTSAYASVYITADKARAGQGLLTMAVKNLAEEGTCLSRRGLTVVESAEPNGMRTLLLADPDGNTIKFFEDPATQ